MCVLKTGTFIGRCLVHYLLAPYNEQHNACTENSQKSIVVSPLATCRPAIHALTRTCCRKIPYTKGTTHLLRLIDIYATMVVHIVHVLCTYKAGPLQAMTTSPWHVCVHRVCTPVPSSIVHSRPTRLHDSMKGTQ